MPPENAEQIGLQIGVDVGGTFTDLVAFDGEDLRVVKVPSTPPQFHRAVVEAVQQALGQDVSPQDRRSARPEPAAIVHGSTVATNALLQRAGEPIAFITTEGFRDMLLIGRQNRPRLYALRVERPAPITPERNWFTVRERIDAKGEVVEPLVQGEIDRVVSAVRGAGLKHAALCLLFSFINPEHEQRLGAALENAGISVSLSSRILPEFREYERASTTTINASLNPTVRSYLQSLESELRVPAREGTGPDLHIMHSGGGTLSVAEAGQNAARLVLSGPAGGVMGAAFVAKQAGFLDVISYDMGGTSTDVATILGAQPQWTTATTIDGLPVGLPMFDIHTVGAGGGSIAYLDAGGALRVGPRSAGAIPGPACYDRGGTEPTVTDANLVLGRLVPEQFLGGAMCISIDLARQALEPLAGAMKKSILEAALGIVRIAEANMAQAIRAVTSRRGHDPRQFTLVSFGGAGGLHACALAESLEIPRVLIPPYAGVLSALGMVVAPPVVDVSQTVVHLGEHLDDARIAAEYGALNLRAMQQMPQAATEQVEAHADVRFAGQSHELKVRVARPDWATISDAFFEAYRALYGHVPQNRDVQVVTLRIRRVGRAPEVTLPRLESVSAMRSARKLVAGDGAEIDAPVVNRATLIQSPLRGPVLLIDPEATTFVPAGWSVAASEDGSVIAERSGGER